MEKKSINKKSVFIIVLSIVLIVIGIVSFNIYKNNKIRALVPQIEQYQKELQFDKVKEVCDKLDKLGYNVDDIKKANEYDLEVADTLINYLQALNDANHKLNQGIGVSLSDVLQDLREPYEAFADLEDSELTDLGKYIKELKDNPVHELLVNKYIYNYSSNNNSLLEMSYVVIVQNAIYSVFDIEQPFEYDFDK
ncbi:MAG: hypothetical protein K2J90_04155 [Lachnospiraceae bacterium]|nr:hypothetical protein [Lachnospiraceae bacterium]